MGLAFEPYIICLISSCAHIFARLLLRRNCFAIGNSSVKARLSAKLLT